jgi:hypothetical protein
MDAGWSSLIGVNPRDLELNCNAYYDHDISTSFQASHSKPSNETQSGVDSWPNVPASTGVFMSGTLAGPYLEMAAFDMNMLAQEGDFQDNGGVGITGIRLRNKN